MAIDEDLSVPYHEQELGYYCGAACAEMVLETIGAGVLDQDDLYVDCHNQSKLDTSVNWWTAPDGLKWTLNHHRPPTYNHPFALSELTSEEAMSRKTCWAIHSDKVAPVALVRGGAHWVVVWGYEASNHPTSAVDPSYTIDAFHVNDPSPKYVLSGPEQITYATWTEDYMTAVSAGYWAGKFVAVGVYDSGVLLKGEPPRRSEGRRKKPPRNGVRRRRPGRGLITPGTAAKRADAGLRAHGLSERRDWHRSLARAKPAPGRLVQRLDRDDTFYSLVPYRTSAGVVAIVSVDARSGEYRQAIFLTKTRRDFIALGPDEALERVAGRRIEFGDGRVRLLMRREAMSLYPHLVWRPCRESLSPYLPFYMFTAGSHQLYVRVDGAIFSSLTLGEMGL